MRLCSVECNTLTRCRNGAPVTHVALLSYETDESPVATATLHFVCSGAARRVNAVDISVFFFAARVVRFMISGDVRDRRLSPCLNGILPCSGLLHRIKWFETDVSGLRIVPVFKG